MVRRHMQHATHYNSPPTAHLVTTPPGRKSRATFVRSHCQKRTERERGVVETSGRNGKKKPLCLPQPRFFAVGWIERQVEGSAAKRPPGSTGGRTAFTKPKHEKMRERELSSNLRIHEST